MPGHSTVDQQLDSNAKGNDDLQEAQAGGAPLMESRAPMFGFAPMPISAAASEANGGGDASPDTLSTQDSVNNPHVRAGISPALNLDQIESVVEAPRREAEQSVEALIDSKDWSTTGLGPRSSWPVELSILLPMLMRSASPLAVYWGEMNHLLYNDVS